MCGPSSAGAAGPLGVGSGPVSRSIRQSVTEPLRPCRLPAGMPHLRWVRVGRSPRQRRAPAGWTSRPGGLLFGSVTQIHDLTVLEQAAAIRTGETSSAEITDHYLDR